MWHNNAAILCQITQFCPCLTFFAVCRSCENGRGSEWSSFLGVFFGDLRPGEYDFDLLDLVDLVDPGEPSPGLAWHGMDDAPDLLLAISSRIWSLFWFTFSINCNIVPCMSVIIFAASCWPIAGCFLALASLVGQSLLMGSGCLALHDLQYLSMLLE